MSNKINIDVWIKEQQAKITCGFQSILDSNSKVMLFDSEVLSKYREIFFSITDEYQVKNFEGDKEKLNVFLTLITQVEMYFENFFQIPNHKSEDFRNLLIVQKPLIENILNIEVRA